MDIFRVTLDKLCGKGGVHCYCCNPSKGQSRFSKKIYRRIARHKLKRSDLNVI